MNKFERVTRTLMWFTALLFATLSAGCGGGGGGGAILGAPNLVSLVSLAVTPAVPIIPITGTQQFTAIATFSDGSTQNVTATSTWTSATLAVATVVPTTGLATGLTAGTSVITASYTASGIVKTATATLAVNAATSVSFKVTPTTATIPVGGTQQFAAIQTFSDGSTIDRTVTSAAGTASWTTSGGSAANATVGAATGLATGVTVTPAGTPVIVNATFTPAGVGAVPLVATPATLIVNAATSVSFVVKPIAASIRVGDIQQFSAIETFSDGTTSDRTLDPLTVWTSVNVPVGGPAVATLSANGATGGQATGKVVGSSTIHAVYTPAGGVAHAATPANLTVTAATLVSVNVTPVAASIVVGGTQQYTATALYSDGTSGDVTANVGTVWTSATPAVAANPVNGLTTGLTAGTSNITAAFGGKTSPLAPAAGGAVLTVTAVNTGPAGALPNLKTAAPFGVMAWDAMTINLGSHIYGDVALPGGVIASVVGTGGVNDGGVAPNLTSSAVTNSAGVTPGQINATNNGTLTPAQLTQLQADLNSVYTTDLQVRAAPVTPLTTIASAANVPGGTFAGATDLSGYVLSPGVYTSPATYGLSNTSGPLVLDAKGNANAVFIIRSTQAGPSGLTSTTGSVVLQGGAQAKNVFWVMDNLTLGAGTFFQGTVVAGHVITLNAGTIVQGRMLAGALGLASGAITLTGNNTITVPQ